MFGDGLFLGYARHMQELDDIAEYIMQAIRTGTENFSTECIDNLSASDIKYIENRIRSYGYQVTLSLN